MNAPGQEGKLKNYYDMLEKNRQKSMFQNDVSKVYMMQNGGASNSPNAQQ